MKKLFSTTIAFACLSFAVVQVYAVVDANPEVASDQQTAELMETMESIAEDMKASDSDDVMDRIDLAIEQIDAMLDEQPANEDDLLDIRDAAVAMRIEAASNVEVPVAETFVSTGGYVSGGSVGYSSGGGYCGACSTGSYSSGGGGALFSGGMNIRRFWPLLGLVALAAIGGDDDAEPQSMPTT